MTRIPPLLRGYSREARTYAKWLVRPKTAPSVKFLIFGPGRAGSTLLADLLNAQPAVCCEDEVLHDRVFAPLTYVHCRSRLCGTPAYGFELLTYQVESVQRIGDPRSFVLKLHRAGYHIIYLTRDDVLRHALSNLYARHTGEFHRKAGAEDVKPGKMLVDLRDLEKWMKGIERVRRLEHDLLRDLPCLELIYENDLMRPDTLQETVNRTMAFLGLPSAPIQVRYRRVASERIADFVENAAEVEEFGRAYANKCIRHDDVEIEETNVFAALRSITDWTASHNSLRSTSA